MRDHRAAARDVLQGLRVGDAFGAQFCEMLLDGRFGGERRPELWERYLLLRRSGA